MSARWAPLVLVALLSGCRQTAPYVHVVVSGALTSVASLQVTATLDGSSMQITAPKTPGTFGLPTDFTLELAADARGELGVDVTALDAQAASLGDGHGQVSLHGNGDYTMTITIGGVQPDAGADLTPPRIQLDGLGSVPPTMASSIQIPVPATVKPNDLMLLTLFARGGGSNTLTTDPASQGWTLDAGVVSGSCGGWTTWYYYKVASATEPASYTAAFVNPDQLSAAVVSYANVDTKSPINNHVSGRFDHLPYGTSLATTAPDTMLVALFAIDELDMPDWGAVPAGMTQEIATITIGVFDELDPTAGPTGTKTVSGPDVCGTYDFVALQPR